jgi:RNA recognition motif-containing protein
MTELYVGNLLYTVTIDEIRDLFLPFGPLHSIDLHIDFDRGRATAHAFLEMDKADAEAAIKTLDGTPFFGQALRVEKTRVERIPEAALHQSMNEEGYLLCSPELS